jgi:antitoxin component YwqK of YwqJK toxin-antitoxin module
MRMLVGKGRHTLTNINSKISVERFYSANKNLEQEYYFLNFNGLIHNDNDLPASISYYPNGNKKSEVYYCHAKFHRDTDNPSVIDYYENGNKMKEIYCKYGITHRDNNLPAIIKYDKFGKVITKYYYKNGIEYFPE